MRRRIGFVCLVALAVAVGPAFAGSAVTTITSGSPGNSVVTSPQFAFTAPGASGYECSIDGGAFAPCSSPATIGPLAFGSHRFTVRGIDAGDGTADAPASVAWTVVAPLATPTILLAAPKIRRLTASRLRTIAGTATAPSGVTSVQVALYRGRPDKSYFPPACHFVALDTGRSILQPCLLPPYVSAHGDSRWHYAVPMAVRRKLKHGSYHLAVRALNSYDNATRHDFPLTVR